MGKRLIISGINSTLNNGCWAMATATINAIKKQYLDVSFIYLNHHASKDQQRLIGEGMIFLNSPWTRIQIPKVRFLYSYFCAFILIFNTFLYSRFRMNIFFRSFCNEFYSADLLIDLGGDSISTDYPDYGTFFQILPSYLMLLLNKPYYFLGQSIGPFKKGTLYKFVRTVLSKASLITVREKISYDFLLNNSIKDHLNLTADSAFLLDALDNNLLSKLLEREQIFRNSKYIGVSVSNLISNYAGISDAHEKYIKTISEICDYLIERYNYNILFVPHVMIPGNDDRITSNQVKYSMRNRKRTIVIEHELNASELKGLTGICSAFIASRMHAAIGAISQYVPTLIFAYNHKTYGIFGEMLNMNDLIIDIKELSKPEFNTLILSKLDYLLENRDSIVKVLKNIVPEIKMQAEKNIELCKELLG